MFVTNNLTNNFLKKTTKRFQMFFYRLYDIIYFRHMSHARHIFIDKFKEFLRFGTVDAFFSFSLVCVGEALEKNNHFLIDIRQ